MDKLSRIARAINGPWSAEHIGREKLTELREVRWEMATQQDQGLRLCQAKAVLAELEIIEQDREGEG